ncbi:MULTISPECIES: winged helix-turn-helix transcriptional regulator [Kordiimonas]|jgi:DNA-binding HxlR family transcriptional regulator|uniref:winged helix-turn-helix transcriptional regulator n=1 Tax=Kordiimonas TaxID=288021 RepID=UPI00257EC3D2|nr:winged helix-turn-helix transcriptional regulator [Kordiimonas sp. UBA4487]
MSSPHPTAQQEAALQTGVWKAFDVVCDTAILLILEACWLGSRRFVDFEQSTGLQKALISDRLKYLVQEGLLAKRPVGNGKHQEYILEERGLALFPTALLMLAWEQKWNASEGPEVKVVHTGCGHELIPELHCKACGDTVAAKGLSFEGGNAFMLGQKGFVKRRRQAGLNRTNTKIFHEVAEIIGDRWMALILRMALIGISRYDDFLLSTGIATNILADRLARAVDTGLMQRSRYQDNPPRYEYQLSEKARDLLSVVLTLIRWGQDWYEANPGEHAVITHSCGKTLHPVVVCQHCGDPACRDTSKLLMGPY